jgi:hypothetical protein
MFEANGCGILSAIHLSSQPDINQSVDKEKKNKVLAIRV